MSKQIPTAAHDLASVLVFLTDLRENNNRAWFEENRDAYTDARTRFENFVGAVMDEIRTFDDLKETTPKDCMFRINRDVRFSKDKSPYKTSMSATIAPGGRHSKAMPYYVSIEPGESMVAGGMYQPETEELIRFRATVAEDSAPFRAIIESDSFLKHFGAVDGERLKTSPPGYKKDNPEIDLLRLKQVLAARRIKDDEVRSPQIVATVADLCRAMKPLHDYLEAVLQIAV